MVSVLAVGQGGYVLRQSYPSQQKPAAKLAEQNPALLANYFKQTAHDVGKDGKPKTVLTLEDARILLPYLLEQGGLPKTAIQHCLAEPGADSIHLILEPENAKGRSNVPAMIDALDKLQYDSPAFKLISKAWTGSTDIPYNARTLSFMFLGHRINAYEDAEQYLDRSLERLPSFWGSYFD